VKDIKARLDASDDQLTTVVDRLEQYETRSEEIVTILRDRAKAVAERDKQARTPSRQALQEVKDGSPQKPVSAPSSPGFLPTLFSSSPQEKLQEFGGNLDASCSMQQEVQGLQDTVAELARQLHLRKVPGLPPPPPSSNPFIRGCCSSSAEKDFTELNMLPDDQVIPTFPDGRGKGKGRHGRGFGKVGNGGKV